MEDVKILLENGIETQVKGIFYVFNFKYYFIYTLGEVVDNDYIQLYVMQVCKEVKNTQQGSTETGNLIGIDISNKEEWSKVQKSIVAIVDDKKSNSVSGFVQYLETNLMKNLRVYSKNKFKLIKDVVYNNFNYKNDNSENSLETEPTTSTTETIQPKPVETGNSELSNVIVDYRAKFFEVEDENEALKEQIKILTDKLASIDTILKK